MTVYGEGTLNYQTTALALPDLVLISERYAWDQTFVFSGYGGGYIAYLTMLVEMGAEVAIGEPFVGRENIPPIHFGEQIASFRTLLKVFKQAKRIVLDPVSAVEHYPQITDEFGITISSAVESFIYDIGTSIAENFLTVDRLLFLSFGCVRGGMTSHYTVEQGDGMVFFRRGKDYRPGTSLAHFRSFEQLHTGVQRSIVIEWPCYMQEKFLIPRFLSDQSSTSFRMIKQVELMTSKTAGPMLVREDSIIGEDFSLSYFIGVPVMFPLTTGNSIQPPAFVNSMQQNIGTWGPSQTPQTYAPSRNIGFSRYTMEPSSATAHNATPSAAPSAAATAINNNSPVVTGLGPVNQPAVFHSTVNPSMDNTAINEHSPIFTGLPPINQPALPHGRRGLQEGVPSPPPQEVVRKENKGILSYVGLGN